MRIWHWLSVVPFIVISIMWCISIFQEDMILADVKLPSWQIAANRKYFVIRKLTEPPLTADQQKLQPPGWGYAMDTGPIRPLPGFIERQGGRVWLNGRTIQFKQIVFRYEGLWWASVVVMLIGIYPLGRRCMLKITKRSA